MHGRSQLRRDLLISGEIRQALRDLSPQLSGAAGDAGGLRVRTTTFGGFAC